MSGQVQANERNNYLEDIWKLLQRLQGKCDDVQKIKTNEYNVPENVTREVREFLIEHHVECKHVTITNIKIALKMCGYVKYYEYCHVLEKQISGKMGIDLDVKLCLKKEEKDEKDFKQRCYICFKHLNDNNDKKVLEECNHEFHDACITQDWLQKNTILQSAHPYPIPIYEKCPKCRNAFLLENIIVQAQSASRSLGERVLNQRLSGLSRGQVQTQSVSSGQVLYKGETLQYLLIHVLLHTSNFAHRVCRQSNYVSNRMGNFNKLFLLKKSVQLILARPLFCDSNVETLILLHSMIPQQGKFSKRNRSEREWELIMEAFLTKLK